MLKQILLSACIILFGCAQQPTTTVDSIPIALTQGVTLAFPTNRLSRIEGDDINFYDDSGFIGFVQRDYLPIEEQPAAEFVMRSFELTKERSYELEEVKLGAFVGYIIYEKNTATLYLAQIQDKETVYTISIRNRQQVDQILNSLAASH